MTDEREQFDLETTRAIEAGSAMDQLQATPGWGRVAAVIQAEVEQSLRTAIRDDKKPRDYWQGRLDGLEWVLGHIRNVIEVGLEAQAARDAERETDAVISLRPSQGVLA